MVRNFLDKFWSKNPSIYLVIVGWGCTAFTAQPYFASLFVHFVIFPMILALVWVFARHEGMYRQRTDKTSHLMANIIWGFSAVLILLVGLYFTLR